MPRAKPPPSARPIRRPPGRRTRPPRNHCPVFCHQPGAGRRATPSINAASQESRVMLYVTVTPRFYRRKSIAGLLGLLVALGGLYVTSLPAQRELSGAAEIKQALDRLNVAASVLMIAAHP